jgi:hypothetical protein
VLSETGSPSFVSYANHMAHMRAALFGRLNAQAMAQGIDPVMEFRGDIHEFFDRWIADVPPMRHVAHGGTSAASPTSCSSTTTTSKPPSIARCAASPPS